MKVLLASSGSGSRGGGEIFLCYLGKGLADRGHEVLLWIPSHPRMDELAMKCAPFARIIRASYRNTYDYRGRTLSTCFNWEMSRRIATGWQALNPSIIHINKQNLEDGLDLLRAARRCAAPSVCTIHLTQTARYLRARAAWFRDRIAHRELSRYRGVFVTVQERRRFELCDFLGGRVRTKTIFNGAPPIGDAGLQPLREAKRGELGLAEGDFLILGVGRLVEQKRPMHFLRIAKELHSRLPAAKFLWVGDGTLAEEWDKTITRERLRGVISRVGWQPDVLPFLLAGDLLLHVAEFEGLPFAVIEAMAAGLACAVTRSLSSEIPYFCEDNVLLVDDVGTLADQLRNPAALARVSGRARGLVRDVLSVDKMAGAYEQLYLEEAGRPSAVAGWKDMQTSRFDNGSEMHGTGVGFLPASARTEIGAFRRLRGLGG